MKRVFMISCVPALLAGPVHADLYEFVLSGQLTEVEDLRTSMNDALDGTAWDYDDYQPSVGDSWEYRIIFDTAVMPQDSGDGEEPYAIYAQQFESSISLAGRSLQLLPSSLFYYNGSDGSQVAELFADYLSPEANFLVATEFARPDMIQELINGGEVPTSADAFDGLNWSGLSISDYDGSFSFATDREAPYTITVTQIPASGTLGLIAFGGFASIRRRR